jgi:hypothetical protein
VQVLDRGEPFEVFPSMKDAVRELLEGYTFAEIERRFRLVDDGGVWVAKWVRRTVGGRELSHVEWMRG